MQYAIISDIHANLQAWNATLLDIRSQKIDEIICLGDIVGYGPNPAEVLQSVHANVDHFVLGNHDAVICGKMDSSLFNDSAQQIIEWTRDKLNPNAIKFLETLPLSLDGGSFRCAHGDFSNPGAFNYIIDPEDAADSWQAVEEQLLFVGHTHRPAIFLLGQSGTPRFVEAQNFELEPEKRFLVNTGSIGQPRDGETRACYCIFDSDRGSVCWRRIPFDIDAYRNALADAGVSEKPSYFLTHDPRKGKPPLREILNFTPAATPEQAVQNAVEVQELTVLKRRVARWKILTTIIVCLSLALITAGGLAWLSYHNRGRRITDPAMMSIRAARVDIDSNLLTIPSTPLDAGFFIPGWTINLGHGKKQSVQVDMIDNSKTMLVITSATRKDLISISSTHIRVEPGMKFCLEAMFRKDDSFEGNVAVVISLVRKTDDGDERIDQYVVKEPNMPRQGGWFLAKKTFEVPANGASLFFQIRGHFTGEATIKDISLCRKQ